MIPEICGNSEIILIPSIMEGSHDLAICAHAAFRLSDLLADNETCPLVSQKKREVLLPPGAEMVCHFREY